MGNFPVFNLSAKSRIAITNAILDLVSKIEDDARREAIGAFFEKYGERYFTAPASTKADFHNPFECGLAEHSLRVYKLLTQLVEMNVAKDFSPSADTLLIVSIFHDVGKMGDETGDLYLKQTSQWHIDNAGQFYTDNQDIDYMKHSHRSLYTIQNIIGITPTRDEYLAILLHDGFGVDINRGYMHHEPWLATLLHMADYMATKLERDRYNRFVKELETA